MRGPVSDGQWIAHFGIKKCQVNLLILTDNDIERLTNANVPKNTDKTMTIKSCKTCVLCDKQQKHLTSHYRTQHANHEVYNCRMSAENSDHLRHNPPQLPNFTMPNSYYSVLCYFCDKDVLGSRSDVVEHIARHTGEYKKRCSACSAIITLDTKRTAECSHVKQKVISSIPNADDIFVYMCSLCNYAQHTEEHIKRHMRNMHDIEPNPTKTYQKVLIIRKLTRSTKSTARKSAGGTTDHIFEPIAPNDDDDNAVESEPVANVDSHIDIDSDSRNLDTASMPDTEQSQSIKVEPSDDGEYSYRSHETPKVIDKNSATYNILMNMKHCEVKLEKMAESPSVTSTPGPASSKKNIGAKTNADDDQWESCSSDEDSIDLNLPSTSAMNTPLNRFRNKTKTNKNRSFMKALKRNQNQNQKPATRTPSPEGITPKLHTVTKRAPLPNDSDENRIFNISYSNYLGQLKLKCSIGNCDYVIINNPTNFSNHLKNAHANEKWNGVCETCDKQILNGAYPLAKEYKHLDDVHLTSSKAQATTSVERKPKTSPTTPTNTKPETPAPKPFTAIKLRRLSGDKLSGNSVAIPDSQPNDLIISSVVSLSSQDNADAPHASTYKNVLKPWTKCQSTKSAIASVRLLKEESLVALYKCMGADCIFTTNDQNSMNTHLFDHEDYHTKQTTNSHTFANTDQSSWLECSYCDQVLGSCHMLTHHIDNVHGTSVFQCAYCFYRSTNMEFMTIHKAKYHANVTADHSVYACGLHMASLLQEIDHLSQMQSNTSKIVCEVPGNSQK